MPFQIDWKDDGVTVYFWGAFDKDVHSDAFLKTVNSPFFRKVKFILWDLSKITEHIISEEESILTAIDDQLLARTLQPVKMAFFVQDATPRRLPRQYTARYRSRYNGWSFMVSNDMSLINSWIYTDRKPTT